MDSMMYQTVGHEMIDLLAEAMQLPLYRQTVEGSCKSAEKVHLALAPFATQSVKQGTYNRTIFRRTKEQKEMRWRICTAFLGKSYKPTLISKGYLWALSCPATSARVSRQSVKGWALPL
jgi:diphthamide synthase (EF-2-diphthine--ammonia ligase)